MRAIGSSCLVITAALSCSLLAQPSSRHLGPPVGRSPAPGGDPMNPGLPIVQPIPMLGMPAPHAPFARPAQPFQPGPFATFPFFPVSPAYLGGGGPAYAPSTTTNIVIVQPTTVVPQQPPPGGPPPEPIRPMLLEVKLSAQPEPLPQKPPVPFVLMGRNGAEYLAMAVVALGDSVYYVDPANRHRRILLAEIDLEKTRQLNRERNLVLHLPAP